MRSSIFRVHTNMFVKMLFAYCLWLALEAGEFAVAKQILHATETELVGPYLAFAVPGAVILPLAWWLKKWEKRAPSPKRLALGWSLCTALFFCVAIAAFYYTGVHLQLLKLSNVWIFVVEAAAGVLVGAIGMYRMVLPRISARSHRAFDSTRQGCDK